MSVLRFRRRPARLALAAALLAAPVAAVGLLVAPAPARADKAPAPEHGEASAPDLAIEIDDGHTGVGPGDRLAYTVKIRNIGAVDATDLLVTLTLPAGARFDSADRDGVFRDGTVTWRTDLPSGRDTTFAVRAEVTKPPPGLLRLAAVVCVAANDDRKPIVCAADSDRLPVGGEEAVPAGAGDRDPSGPPTWLLALSAGAGVVLSFGGALLLRYSYRRASRRDARTRRVDHLALTPGPEPERDAHGHQEAGPSSLSSR